MAVRIELHPATVAEAAEARRWYEERSHEVAAAVLAEVDRVIARIADDPSSLPLHRHGTRHCLFRRFPYLVVFHERRDAVQVIAVAHVRRRPGY